MNFMAGTPMEIFRELNTLVFDSTEFLFWYLPFFLLFFALSSKRVRPMWTFLFSMLLYVLACTEFAPVLLGLTAADYGFGLWQKKWKKAYIAGIALHLVPLVCMKGAVACSTGFLMPVGFSFFAFKSISYLCDVAWGKTEAETNFFRLAAWLCFFGQIVCGPLSRYEDSKKAIEEADITWTCVEEGLMKLAAGLGAKVLVADRLAIFWNEINTIGFESISTPLAWLGMLSYSLQLYFDFAGYSLMAIGIGEMIGLPIVVNFHHPYAAESISAFYRRWHMTLGSWFRDYVYIPMGGNRCTRSRLTVNLLVVWLLTGLWHGAALHYLLWGLILGLLIIGEKLWWGQLLSAHKKAAHLYVLLVIPVTWMFFAIEELDQLWIYLQRLIGLAGSGASRVSDFGEYLTMFAPALLAAVILCIPAVSDRLEKYRHKIIVKLIIFVIFWAAVYCCAIARNNPFMYAAF